MRNPTDSGGVSAEVPLSQEALPSRQGNSNLQVVIGLLPAGMVG